MKVLMEIIIRPLFQVIKLKLLTDSVICPKSHRQVSSEGGFETCLSDDTACSGNQAIGNICRLNRQKDGRGGWVDAKKEGINFLPPVFDPFSILLSQ